MPVRQREKVQKVLRSVRLFDPARIRRAEPIILGAMFARRRRWLHAALYFVIVLGALHAQNAALADDHHHGAHTHCCDLCHHGQMPMVERVMAAQPAPPADLGWSTRSEAGGECPEPAFPESPSRAPPALSL